MTGETDSGLSFGVSVDLDEAGNLGDSTDNNGTAIFLSGAFGTLTVGNTDGAMDFALTEIVGPGSLTDQETSHDGFKGSYLDGSYDGQIARYDYTAGDLSVAVSAEILDADAVGRSSGYGFGVKYALGNITLGAGYQAADSLSAAFGGNAAAAEVVTPTTATTNTVTAAVAATVAEVDATGVSVSGTFGAVTAGITYTAYDSSIAAFDATHTSVGISYTQGAMTIGANYGDFDSDTNAQDRDGMALTANYSLGGGATLQAGYETSDGGAAGADRGDSWSLGLAMSF